MNRFRLALTLSMTLTLGAASARAGVNNEIEPPSNPDINFYVPVPQDQRVCDDLAMQAQVALNQVYDEIMTIEKIYEKIQALDLEIQITYTMQQQYADEVTRLLAEWNGLSAQWNALGRQWDVLLRDRPEGYRAQIDAIVAQIAPIRARIDAIQARIRAIQGINADDPNSHNAIIAALRADRIAQIDKLWAEIGIRQGTINALLQQVADLQAQAIACRNAGPTMQLVDPRQMQMGGSGAPPFPPTPMVTPPVNEPQTLPGGEPAILPQTPPVEPMPSLGTPDMNMGEPQMQTHP